MRFKQRIEKKDALQLSQAALSHIQYILHTQAFPSSKRPHLYYSCYHMTTQKIRRSILCQNPAEAVRDRQSTTDYFPKMQFQGDSYS